MKTKGKFISFEGGEGAGKSTQIQRLGEFLRSRGIEVLLTREPGGTALGEDLRKIIKFAPYGKSLTLEAEAMLFATARAQLVREIIVPALARGTWVIADRFVDSSIAYQGAGRGLGMQKIADLNRFATGDLEPDLTFLIDVPVEIGFARMRSREAENAGTADRMETLEREFYEKVRTAYLQLAAENPARILRIDGTGTLDEIAGTVEREVSKILGIANF